MSEKVVKNENITGKSNVILYIGCAACINPVDEIRTLFTNYEIIS